MRLRTLFCVIIIAFGLVQLPLQVVHACTMTPSPTPTATPDANGYIPPTRTPRPTYTPVPVGTRVAHIATRSVVIVEGQVADAEQYQTPTYYTSPGTAVFEVDHYYKGVGEDSLTFSYFVVPCPGAKPPFADSPQGVFFFTEDTAGGLHYNSYLPADDDTRHSLAVAVGPGQQPHAFYPMIVPCLFMMAGIAGLWLRLRRNW